MTLISSATHLSMCECGTHGRIVTAWKVDGQWLSLDVTIPANTSAVLYLPTKVMSAVTESGKRIANAEGVKFLRIENENAVYSVESGNYSFRSIVKAGQR